jgi:hypothetical protein
MVMIHPRPQQQTLVIHVVLSNRSQSMVALTQRVEFTGQRRCLATLTAHPRGF